MLTVHHAGLYDDGGGVCWRVSPWFNMSMHHKREGWCFSSVQQRLCYHSVYICYFLLEDQASFSRSRCTSAEFAYFLSVFQCVALLNYYFVCLHQNDDFSYSVIHLLSTDSPDPGQAGSLESLPEDIEWEARTPWTGHHQDTPFTLTLALRGNLETPADLSSLTWRTPAT